jgi:prephenate dehydrogenase
MSATNEGAEVAVIGLGVIGGSAALRVSERGTKVRGFSTSAADRALAADAGLSVASSLDEAVRGVGLVLIAVPLDHICAVAGQVIGAAPSSATILHAGSLQRSEALRGLPEVMSRLLGTHPLAGSHRTGFAAARRDLFRDAIVFVEQRGGPRQKEDAEFFWSLAGARRIEYASAHDHDDVMAWVSHLPQLASTALAGALAGSVNRPLPVRAGPGARDATRLAMSNYEMWRPILERAPEETLSALRALESGVQDLRAALETGDWQTIRDFWLRAAAWREAAEPGAEAEAVTRG